MGTVYFERGSMKVAVALSGGVDSAVAAALLKEEGYRVIGVTMQIWPSGELAEGVVSDAKRVADRLDIAHYVVDCREVFTQKVIAHFCHEYSRGRTPNPCIRCNQFIKFGALLERARELGADFIATGHYARIEKDVLNGRYTIKKGNDRSKDQSYFLYTMTQEQLRYSLFPLGELNKERVRRIAGESGLPVASRTESRDICFIPDSDYPKFLGEYAGGAARPGPILDRRGKILGDHKGLIFYTIGQRKGLGISAGEPLYVVAINRERNAVIVGRREETYGSEFIASELNWLAIEEPKQPMKVKARIRYLHQEAVATVIPAGEDRAQVTFEEPQMALTPGQAVVFYDGDTVIGGGSIEQVKL